MNDNLINFPDASEEVGLRLMAVGQLAAYAQEGRLEPALVVEASLTLLKHAKTFLRSIAPLENVDRIRH